MQVWHGFRGVRTDVRQGVSGPRAHLFVSVFQRLGQGRPQEVKEAPDRLRAIREAATVRIDTRLEENSTGLRTPREVESLLARMRVVVTTLLHGTALSLKKGVPAAAMNTVCADYEKHSRWALEVAKEYLSAPRVLRRFLEEIGV